MRKHKSMIAREVEYVEFLKHAFSEDIQGAFLHYMNKKYPNDIVMVWHDWSIKTFFVRVRKNAVIPDWIIEIFENVFKTWVKIREW